MKKLCGYFVHSQCIMRHVYGPLAQLVAQWTPDPKVRCSSRLRLTFFTHKASAIVCAES